MIKRIIAAALVTVVLSARLCSQSTIFTIYGDQSHDFFGSAVADAGDVDHDGVHDFIAGAPLHGKTERGFVRVYSGLTGAVLWQFNGQAAVDWFGYAVSSAGDLDHDDHADVVIGAPRELSGTSIGAVRVYSGKDGSLLWLERGADGDPQGRFGYGVAGVGDVDNDGTDDFAAGAPTSDVFGPSAGYVKVFSGADGSELWTWHGGDQDFLGASVSGIGDVSGDGVPDVLAGAPVDVPARSGYAQVFSGADGSVVYTLPGTGVENWFGRSVSGGHDVNLDGVNDFVVSAFQPGGVWGYAVVYSGMDGSVLWTVSGDPKNEYGTSACTAADVNGDGYADFMVGEPRGFDNPNLSTGAVHVYSGKDGSLFLSRYGCWDTPNAGMGWSVSGLVDVNGDGLNDMLMGSPFESWFPQINQGALRVIGGTCCPSFWLNYGEGWPGTLGTPAITLGFDPDICTQVPVLITNSSGSDTLGLILIGGFEDKLPTVWDGSILLRPMVAASLWMRARGERIQFTVPCDQTLRGATVFAQCMEIDTGASKGVSFSRGLKAVLGD
jgi:hypothetical protein